MPSRGYVSGILGESSEARGWINMSVRRISTLRLISTETYLQNLFATPLRSTFKA